MHVKFTKTKNYASNSFIIFFLSMGLSAKSFCHIIFYRVCKQNYVGTQIHRVILNLCITCFMLLNMFTKTFFFITFSCNVFISINIRIDLNVVIFQITIDDKAT